LSDALSCYVFREKQKTSTLVNAKTDAKNPSGFLTLFGSWAVSLLRPLTLRPQVALSFLLSV